MLGLRRILVCLLAFAAATRAADLPSAGSPTLNGESHAWVALPAGGSEPGAAIVHLPPRRDPGRSDGRGDSEDGSVHLAARIAQMPERLAAWDRQLWLAFSAEPTAPGKRQRRVLTMSVQRGPLAGAWIPTPQGERMPTVTALPGEGGLEGFIGTARGPIALIQQRADSTGRARYSLLLLVADEWRAIELPDRWWQTPSGSGSEAEGSRLELVAAKDGPILVVVSETAGGIWAGHFRSPAGRPADRDPEAAPAVEWTWSPLSFRDASGSPAPALASPVVLSGGQFVYAGGPLSDRGVRLVNLTPAAARTFAPVRTRAEFALVALDQVGRVGLVWQEPEPQTPGAVPQGRVELKTNVVELSAATGHPLFEGPAKVGGPVSSRELKLLALCLVGVMIVVVAVILKPGGDGATIALPKGYALAEPGRRMVAAGLDVLLAAFTAAAVLGVSLPDLLSADVLSKESGGISALLLILAIGYAHTTLGDWLAGRSIGKFATGCMVVRAEMSKDAESGELTPVLIRPALWRSAVRNLVCWTLPPLAMWGMGTGDHRHRGDIASGLVVVIEAEEEPAPD